MITAVSESNPDQRDVDEDGKGDICDDDIDGDGIFQLLYYYNFIF